MSDIQLAALEVARTIVTEGLGEKRPAHGLCIIVGDAEEIVFGAELVDDRMHFQGEHGSFRSDLDRRHLNIDIRDCERGPGHRVLCNLCFEDGAVVVDSVTGQVYCGGFFVQNTSGSKACDGARTRAASAMGAMRYYVIMASESICGSIDNPPHQEASFKIFDRCTEPTHELVRQAVDALRQRIRAVELTLKEIEELMLNYKRLLIPYKCRRDPSAYSVALALLNDAQRRTDYTQERLDKYRDAHDNLKKFCKNLQDAGQREEVIAAIISAPDENSADFMVGEHLITYRNHQAELFFHPSLEDLKECLGSRPPKLLIFQGCSTEQGGAERGMRLRFWNERDNREEDVDATTLGSLLNLTSSSDCVLLNMEDSVNLCHDASVPKNIKVIAWRSCVSCLKFNRMFLSSFREGSQVRGLPRVESAYLLACEEIAVSLDTPHELPVTILHSSYEEELQRCLKDIEPKRVTYRIRLDGNNMTDKDARSCTERLKELLPDYPALKEKRTFIRLEGPVTKAKLEEAGKIVKDLRFMGVEVEVEFGSILLDCRIRDVDAFRFYVRRSASFTSVIPSEVFVDTKVLRHLKEEDGATVKNLIAALERSPLPGERVLALLLRSSRKLTIGQIRDAVEQQAMHDFSATDRRKRYSSSNTTQKLFDLVLSSKSILSQKHNYSQQHSFSQQQSYSQQNSYSKQHSYSQQRSYSLHHKYLQQHSYMTPIYAA